MKTIIVAGYPRSGNVWMSRLLSDVFNCSIRASKNRVSVAQKSRDSTDYLVIQEHFKIREQERFTETIYINPKLKPVNVCLVYMYRNSLDVAVSAYKYWKISSIYETLKIMETGGILPKYSLFMGDWIDNWDYIDFAISYEELIQHPRKSLQMIVKNITTSSQEIKYEEIIERNNIKNIREKIKKEPSKFSYNKEIQMNHLRKGVINDWINHFTVQDLEYAFSLFGHIIVALGYADNYSKSFDEIFKRHAELIKKKNE